LSIFDNLRWSATGESTFDELSPLKPGHVVPSSFSACLKPLSFALASYQGEGASDEPDVKVAAADALETAQKLALEKIPGKKNGT
jgi:hypothetical protein